MFSSAQYPNSNLNLKPFVSFLLYKDCFLEEYEYEKAKGEDIVNFDFCLLFYFIVSLAIDRISKSGSRWEYAVKYSFCFANALL